MQLPEFSMKLLEVDDSVWLSLLVRTKIGWAKQLRGHKLKHVINHFSHFRLGRSTKQMGIPSSTRCAKKSGANCWDLQHSQLAWPGEESLPSKLENETLVLHSLSSAVMGLAHALLSDELPNISTGNSPSFNRTDFQLQLLGHNSNQSASRIKENTA